LANTVGYVLYSLPLKHDIQIYADLLYAVDIMSIYMYDIKQSIGTFNKK